MRKAGAIPPFLIPKLVKMIQIMLDSLYRLLYNDHYKF